MTVNMPMTRSPDGTPDLVVLHLKKLEFFGGQYTENGKVVSGMLVKDGDEWYLDPDGGSWLGRLRPLSEKLTKSATERYEQLVGVQPKDLPMTDNVDVVAEEIAKS